MMMPSQPAFFLVAATLALCSVPAFGQDPAQSRAGHMRFAQAQLSAEDIFWQSIQSSSDPAMFQAYLDQVRNGRFPGTYKALAEIKIGTLRKDSVAAPSPAAPTPGPATRPVTIQESVPAPRPEQATATSPEIDSCDRAAAASTDKEKPAAMPGVSFGSIDVGAAIRACRQAMEVPSAPRRVFFQVARAIYKSGNIGDAITSYKRAVDLGHAGAMHDLAGIMRAGRGIKPDAGLAMNLYERAAAAGVVESVVKLGEMYTDGRGVPRDYAKAREYYQRAVDARAPGGYTNLGVLYYEGRGVPRDSKKACDYWREGASLGDDAAAKNLKRSCRFSAGR